MKIIKRFWFVGLLSSVPVMVPSFSPLLNDDGTFTSVTINGGKYIDGFVVLPVQKSKWLTFARLPVYLGKNDVLFEHTDSGPGVVLDQKNLPPSLSKQVEKVTEQLQKKDFVDQLGNVMAWHVADDKANRLFRLNCFYEVMGSYEIEFRGWNDKDEPKWGKYPPLEALRATKDGFIPPAKVSAYPFGRNALCGSRFFALSIGELEAEIADARKIFKPQQGGSFALLDGYAIKDKQGVEEALKLTDIAHLQAHNPSAIFQIASTFNALEGGMGKDQTHYGRRLEEMQFKPTQGENAALATMGATIIRKYVLPPINLLEGLGDKVEMNKNAAKNGLVWKFSKKLDSSDVKLVKVGLHADVVVTSDYYGCYSDALLGTFAKKGGDADERIKFLEDRLVVAKGREPFFVFNGLLDLSDLEKLIRIDQVFTAAVSLIEEKKGPTLSARNLTDDNAKVILEAAYKGTMLVAAKRAVEKTKAGSLKGAQKVYLTLVGAGAFNNKVEWIVALLSQSWFTELINDFGLEVYLVIYPSPRKGKGMTDEDLERLRKLAADLQTKIVKKKIEGPQGPGGGLADLSRLAEALRQLAVSVKK